MLLVATAAISLHNLRSVYSGWTFNPNSAPLSYLPITLILFAPGVLAPVSLALFLIRLRRPRPVFRRIGQQPGFVASGLVVASLGGAVVLMIGLALTGLISSGVTVSFRPTMWMSGMGYFTYLGPPIASRLYLLVVEMTVAIAPAIPGGWFALAWAGRLRGEPGWIDPMGIAVGACWVVVWAAKVWLNLV